jgi:iron complex transport system permease protein
MSADALPVRLATIRRHERRRATGVVVALLAAIVVFVACEVVVGGSADIPLSDIPLAAIGRGEGLAHYVVFETRMPRALTAVLAGALFGLAGQIYQRLVGNVLATPDILGISAGAAAAATAVLTLGIVGVGVQLAAVGGSLVVGIAVFALSWRGGVAPYRLVLVGIGLGACASAVTTYLVTRADEMSVERALRWMIGSLSGADWQGVGILAATFALGGVAAIALAPALRTFALGDDLAAGLGTRVSRVRFGALLLGAALAAIATSITGPIGFVALVSGPLASRLTGRADAPLVAATVGAAVVSAADLISQTAPLIAPVPTGSITAIVGAPVLIYLLIRTRRTP